MLFAEKIAQTKGVVIPDDAKASSAAMSAWIDSNQGKKRGKGRRKPVNTPPRSMVPKSTAPKKRSRKPAANDAAAFTPLTSVRENSGTDTPLRIPYGNKDDALKLGARYRAGGWYAPPGVDLTAFGERGWL
jgi:DNA topoisomerase-3